MALATEYRPTKLKDFVGNESVKKALQAMLKRPVAEIPHAILFTGMTGCGKTTLARMVAKYLKCSDKEFIEMNSADFRGIDSIREVIRQSHWAPMDGDIRVWLFDEVHKQSNDAQNAMLKMLEDAPDHVYYILATTDPQKLIPTLKGRCTTFEVKPLETEEMVEFLQSIVAKEEKEVPEKILFRIATDSRGSCRNALQVLERIIDLPVKEMEGAAKQVEETEAQTIDLCRALFKEKPSWSEIAGILSTLQTEPESVRYAVLGYCNAILMKGKPNQRAFDIMLCCKDTFYYTGKPGLTMAMYDVVFGG